MHGVINPTKPNLSPPNSLLVKAYGYAAVTGCLTVKRVHFNEVDLVTGFNGIRNGVNGNCLKRVHFNEVHFLNGIPPLSNGFNGICLKRIHFNEVHFVNGT